MIILIFNIILIFIVDTVLIGLSFFALREKFKWDLSPKKCFIILILIFALYDSYIIPILLVLDATLTIRNEAFAKVMGISPTFPVVELYGLEFFNFIIWCLQAFLAGLIGERFVVRK